LLRRYFESNASCSRVYAISRGQRGSIRKRKFIYTYTTVADIIIRIPTGYATRRNTIIIILYRVGPNKDALLLYYYYYYHHHSHRHRYYYHNKNTGETPSFGRISPPPGCIILYTCYVYDGWWFRRRRRTAAAAADGGGAAESKLNYTRE